MVEDNQEQGGGAAPLPDEQGFYGEYGGRYVPEMLVPALDELEEAYHHWKEEEGFVAAVEALLKNYSGRPTWAQRMSGARPPTSSGCASSEPP